MTDKPANKARTWNGRYVNIAHRRSPSELTPLIQQNLALQQQVELLTAQNQHILQQQLAAPNLVAALPPAGALMPPPPPFAHHRQPSASGHASNAPPNHQRQRSQGHVRRHSLAVSEAKRAAQERTAEPEPPAADPTPEFRFPPAPSRGHARSQSAHLRKPSNFHFPPSENRSTHQRHGSFGNYPAYTPNPNFGANPSFNNSPSSNANAYQTHRARASNASEYAAPSGRKSLFVPYLPQSAIPEMLSDGLLVTGTLRVNHKNRSYAYVSTDVLDAEVFIAGSKDRNRALEGDVVAVELLDVNDVWDQKREKEERKRRRDLDAADQRLVATAEGQLRRRGSLRQREPQKRHDDVEVEGQTLLLREELGTGDEKPLYAGHVVAVLERPAGQLFSGTLGLLRPSSQASKERHSRSNSTVDDAANHHSPPSHSGSPADRPKIVWFKPVDKCVPLMAIPTEQAPPDLVDNPQAYANQVFVAQIKRWPITSLHPFGMLMERLGVFGDPQVSQRATLREFNFGPHQFSAEAAAEAQRVGTAMRADAETRPLVSDDVVRLAPDLAASLRRDAAEDVLAVHVLDLTPFVERNGALDRELRHKSASVEMQSFSSPLIPVPAAAQAVQLAVGVRSPVLTVEFGLESSTVRVRRRSVCPVSSACAASGALDDALVEPFVPAVAILRRRRGLGAPGERTLDLSALLDVVVPAKPPLADLSTSEQIVMEIMHAANAGVASELLRSQSIGLGALVRRQSEPTLARLEQLTSQLKRQGVRVDASSAHALAQSLTNQLDARQLVAVKASLAKILSPQRYAVAYRTNPGQLGHYWFGFDAYTHFTRPLLRYSDHVVARQVHAMLASDHKLDANGDPLTESSLRPAATSSDSTNDETTGTPGNAGNPANPPTATKTTSPDLSSGDPFGAVALAPELSFRYDCARGVQEQSFHLALAEQLGEGYALHLGVVTAVYESAFDVVIPELSVEKRVHGDQLPLVKAEFHADTELLELFWKPNGQRLLSEIDLESDHTTPPIGSLSVGERFGKTSANSSAGSASTAYSSAGDMSSTPVVEITKPEAAAVPEVSAAMRKTLSLRPNEHVQEIRPLQDVPVLVRVVSRGRVLPSIVVLAAFPFAKSG